ncbi:hypothetical protein I6J18_00755 [Peribacillus psychrosaccharolyticus]|uniref:Uncharacterized protein n=1 Tax=Peribacillus psychrosaccharolyticus TaxID=1407 RepID=A0A974NM88_PERPY|nr:hypothetical protein [Peribacillus psychrosaccharolyticus]MEC2056316.1 hypothetical protein [Peribacillus psychrosaccharolyticus]MED3743718.1 hypothetical protein [Peribacillus psychrosaccharolyticus]QQT00516.1 hypothetical protein I6J18_00755 [Peribacillus psychrosaccharolyticus]
MKKRVILSMVATLALSFSLALNVQASVGKITKSENVNSGLISINISGEGENTRPH